MWILLMVVFSQPYEISTVDILNTYYNKKACTDEVNRALSITVPVNTSFGCLKIERLGRIKK
tara:strand:- start:74 stop:259 length:186 start_codon:yes stop_codon:yes gene_type:complete